MFPNELIAQMNRGDVILFVGAGLSMNASLPGWTELAHSFADAVRLHRPEPEDITTEHLLSSFQYFENQYGRNAMLQAVQSRLETAKISPAAAHYLITLLPVQTIFTTNYDDLLERAYRDIKQAVHAIVNSLELAYWSQDQIQVIKLCGDLSRPESIVITRSDFNIYSETHRRLIEQLRTMLETKTALFLGYSLKDPFINQIWDAIRLTQGVHHKMAYALLFHANSLELDDFRKRGIQAIQPEVQDSIENAFLTFMLGIIKALRPPINEEKIRQVAGYVPQWVAAELNQYSELGRGD